MEERFEVVDQGTRLTVVSDPVGRRYYLGRALAYRSDNGCLLRGVLLWDGATRSVFLESGGRRTERSWLRAPRWVGHELGRGQPVRVFAHVSSALWAAERGDGSFSIRDAGGNPLVVATRLSSGLDVQSIDRDWDRLGEATRLARAGLVAQVVAASADSARDRETAEAVRVATTAASHAPRPAMADALRHVALASTALDRGPWGRVLGGGQARQGAA